MFLDVTRSHFYGSGMKRRLSRLLVALTGFKPSRIREWRTAVTGEARTLGWGNVVWELAKGSLGLRNVGATRWRQRMRACRRCPIFDPRSHKCRDTAGKGLGCGCWMPAKALVEAKACWVRSLGETAFGFD